MLTHLGWNDATSSSMYNDQAINSIDEFRSLEDESIKNICKVMRQPVGVTATGVMDPGFNVNTRADSNLIFAVYFIKHRDRVSRYVTFRNMTLTGVRKISVNMKWRKMPRKILLQIQHYIPRIGQRRRRA